MAFDYAKKIGALLANAEDETLPEAARASYRAKAEQMMREYRIAEEEAIATEGSSNVPMSDTIVVMEKWAYSNPLRSHYWTMLSAIAGHCGVRIDGKYTGWHNEDSALVATVVGYEGDIRYAELLYMAARLVFLTRIDTKVDRSLTDAENCYFMRGSGLSRKEIATALWGSEATDGAAHGKVQKYYVAECAKRGETPKVSGRGIQVSIYREAYANAFVNELYWRLNAAASAVDKQSGGLVLHGRKERVDEAFYQMFPERRPKTAEERAAQQAQWAAEEVDCEACKKTKHASGQCTNHRPRALSAAERRRYDRLSNSAEAHAGQRAGAAAAKEIHMGRTSAPAPRQAPAAQQARELS